MIIDFESATKYAQKLFDIKNDVIKEIEKESLDERVPIITRDVLSYMVFEAKREKAKKILEVGTATGFSGIFLAQIANENGGNLTTIEIDETRHNKAKENFERVGLLDKNNLILGDGLEELPKLKAKGEKYDFIFIDASKGQYKKFFEESYEMLEENGTIFIDNIMFRGMVTENIENVNKKYKTLVRKLNEFIHYLNDNYNFVLLPFGDGVGIVKKESEK